MELNRLLERNRAEIESKLLEAALSVYPAKSQPFLNSRMSPFANPVGNLLREQISSILQKLIDDQPVEAFTETLSDLAKIRAVQDFEPSRALEFLFSAKSIIADGAPNHLDVELRVLESKIDRLALHAFDLYEKHRSRIFELRIRELRRTWGSSMGRRAKQDSGGGSRADE